MRFDSHRVEARKYKEMLVRDIDRDADAYNQVVKAYKLPKTNQEQKTKREENVQHALKHAARVPLGVAETAFELMDLAQTIAEKGNQNAVTDTAVAIMQLRTAVLAALYNVKINLTSIEDEKFTKKVYIQIGNLEEKAISKEQELLSKINI